MTEPNKRTLSERWTDVINAIRKPVNRGLLALVDTAAARPRTCVASIIVFSIAVMAIGIFTNFSVDVNEDVLWTPEGSRPIKNYEWITDESNFPKSPRDYLLLVHVDGKNVATEEGIRRLFAAVDTVRNTPNFETVCLESPRDQECDVIGATQFWNNTVSIFEAADPANFYPTLLKEEFPDETPVDRTSLFGNGVFNNVTGEVTVEAFVAIIRLPDTDDAETFETDSLERLEELKDLWETEANNPYRVDYFAQRSFADEFTRAIVTDIPLVPAVFIVMSIFTCVVFFRRDWVHSRSTLGFGAVTCVLLSILTGYGLLFIIGVPFTSMTQVRCREQAWW